MTTKHQNWCRLCGTRFVANSRMELEEQFFLHSASSEETGEDSFVPDIRYPGWNL